MNIENNKLIAEFMGIHEIMLDEYSNYEIDDIYPILGIEPHHHKGLIIHESDLQFHTSWEWLIPVVEKIESLNVVCFEKNLQEEGDYQCLFTKGNDIFICHYADTSKEATYKAVVEFIKWYNEREK